MTKSKIASYIDHTLLAPQAGIKQIVLLCQEAKRYNFASVCVNPIYVSSAAEELSGSGVKVCTVVGFPLGATTTKDKINESKNAIANGADEIDMVINIGAAKDGRFSEVGTDILGVVKACKTAGKKLGKNIIVKTILETCLLDDNAIVNCCLCAKKAGADFVKTSTGFATPKGVDGNPLPNGASEHHVSLMRKTVGDDMGVKASGGIRSARTAISMLEAGANRIGTSSGVSILENWDESETVNSKY
ncbi:MAG: deoxyribose-phosphate aldolase [Treponema sp.]|nr:deoxyribose-phosphate aldolase [Treponema sp.]